MLPKNNKRKFAIVCSSGIGDALIFSIAAHHLKNLGHEVTFFHRLFPQFGQWLEPGDYRPLRSIEDLFSFDAVLLQHDNTERAYRIAALRKQQLPVYIFYPSYRLSKHGPLSDQFDFPFDEDQNMVDNLLIGIQKLFGHIPSKQNNLSSLTGLVHRKNSTRIAIHPTSGAEWRNWPRRKFLQVVDRIQRMNFQPVFLMSPQERSHWPQEFTPLFPTLEELASYLYESGFFIGNNSGLGHLASYLQIPHIILGHQERHMRQWRPGWRSGICLTPPQWIPNWKGFRIRERWWHRFIPSTRVLWSLQRLIED